MVLCRGSTLVLRKSVSSRPKSRATGPLRHTSIDPSVTAALERAGGLFFVFQLKVLDETFWSLEAKAVMILPTRNTFRRALQLLHPVGTEARGSRATETPDQPELTPISVHSTRIWGTRMVFQAEATEHFSKFRS